MTLLSSNKQEIGEGSNNIQAGGDVIIQCIQNKDPMEPIRFYEDDICAVLEEFDNYVEEIEQVIVEESNFELDYIEKPEKNRLNNLSEEYFEYMTEEYLSYFYKIDEFLKAPQNKEHLKKYKNTAKGLNMRIAVIRKNYQYFEDVLLEFVNAVENSKNDNMKEHRILFMVFLHYMYWNCDIGRKKKRC